MDCTNVGTIDSFLMALPAQVVNPPVSTSISTIHIRSGEPASAVSTFKERMDVVKSILDEERGNLELVRCELNDASDIIQHAILAIEHAERNVIPTK